MNFKIRSFQWEEFCSREIYSRIQSVLRNLGESPGAVIIAMRFIGLGMTGALIIVLMSGGPDFVTMPLGAFIVYILVTTVLACFAKSTQSQLSMFLLFLLDILTISFVLSVVQILNKPLVALDSLYLVGLIIASLFDRRLIIFLGIAVLFGYLGKTWVDTPNMAAIFNGEHLTQVILFVFITALVAAQSYYFSYINRKREGERRLLQDKLVFTTAHDLRAPFALIRLLAEKYENRQPHMPTQLGEDMETITTSVAMASRLLEDLLSLAKGENINVNIVPINIVPQINQLIKHWEFAIKKKHIIVEYPEQRDIAVLVDIQKFGYVLDNLISNGVKYNNKGGTLRIWHEIKKDNILTMVENTGVGIDPKNLSSVFTPYFRELKDSSIPGTGLGLYSAKKFIELINGTIEVSSTPHTTRFTITLPTPPKNQD